MLIVVTDEGRFWNHRNPVLERYSDNVLVICLGGKKVTDRYRCFVNPYREFKGLGMPDESITGKKYRALASAEYILRNIYDNHDDAVFLTDGEPASLFPYMILRDDRISCRLHLWCMPPLGFEGKRRMKLYSGLLYDISNLKSLLCFDSVRQRSVYKSGGGAEAMYKYCEELLPSVLYDIERNMQSDSRYYFDFTSKRYIETDAPYESILRAAPLNSEETDRCLPGIGSVLMGDLMLEFADKQNENSRAKQEVEALHPRFDGREICGRLKEMRKRLAAANDIEFETADCPSDGPCAGTCPKCDSETAELQRKMMELPPEKRIYPEFRIERRCGVPEVKRFDGRNLEES